MNEISNYPVDAIISWVDGGDIEHQKKMSPYIEMDKVNRNRFDQVEEIKFTIDSILKFAPFVKNIYIITDNQTPLFLKEKEKDKKYENVKIIDHKIIFKNKESFLPVFNSRSIETRLHRIPDLSEHFIYFNDDFFLIKETKLSDFFIDGLPVLRGRWKYFYENRIDKKIFSKKGEKTRASHRKGQEQGAKAVGFNKFYKFDHTPHPLRKSTFVNFFKENPELEDTNSAYRFRYYNQFIPQGLANHIEIKNKTCVLKKDYQLVFIQNYERSFFSLKKKLSSATKSKNKLFLNMQGLNQCPKEKLDYILNWLEETIN